MQSTQRIWFAGILVLGLVWIGVSADRLGKSTNGLIPAPQKGFLAPDFTLESMSGESVTLSDLRGQVVIVNLWASWCGPCRLEMPALKDIFNEYKENGLVILAVNSTSQDSRSAVEKFVAEYQLPFTVLLDTEGAAAQLYQLSALPSTFFIGRDGLIRRVVIGGPLAESTLRAEIESLLAEELP
jgi:cytochrome c biogenesis protein CcmG, thiol:disulfide interchange protein DsbE